MHLEKYHICHYSLCSHRCHTPCFCHSTPWFCCHSTPCCILIVIIILIIFSFFDFFHLLMVIIVIILVVNFVLVLVTFGLFIVLVNIVGLFTYSCHIALLSVRCTCSSLDLQDYLDDQLHHDIGYLIYSSFTLWNI